MRTIIYAVVDIENNKVVSKSGNKQKIEDLLKTLTQCQENQNNNYKLGHKWVSI